MNVPREEVDPRLNQLFTAIRDKPRLGTKDFDDYLRLLNKLHDTDKWWLSGKWADFTEKCVQEILIYKRKLYDQSLAKSYKAAFPRVTETIARFILHPKCGRNLFTAIIETWNSIIPTNKSIILAAIVANQKTFIKLFDLLRSLGNVILQLELILLLLMYTSESSLTCDQLCNLAIGPAYGRVRPLFTLADTGNIDLHCLNMLRMINEDSTEKLVVRLSALVGQFKNHTARKTIKNAIIDGTAQILDVFFHLGKYRGISFLYDKSTFENDDTEQLYTFEKELNRIRKITFKDIPAKRIFAIIVYFKYVDDHDMSRVELRFNETMKARLIDANIFELFRIVQCGLDTTSAASIETASTTRFGDSGKTKLYKISARQRTYEKNVVYTTSATTVEHTGIGMYVSDSDPNWNQKNDANNQTILTEQPNELSDDEQFTTQIFRQPKQWSKRTGRESTPPPTFQPKKTFAATPAQPPHTPQEQIQTNRKQIASNATCRTALLQPKPLGANENIYPASLQTDHHIKSPSANTFRQLSQPLQTVTRFAHRDKENSTTTQHHGQFDEPCNTFENVDVNQMHSNRNTSDSETSQTQARLASQPTQNCRSPIATIVVPSQPHSPADQPVLSIAATTTPVQSPVAAKENSKSTRRLLFNAKHYNEMQLLPKSRFSGLDKNRPAATPLPEPKALHRAADDPFRIMDLTKTSEYLIKMPLQRLQHKNRASITAITKATANVKPMMKSRAKFNPYAAAEAAEAAARTVRNERSNSALINFSYRNHSQTLEIIPNSTTAAATIVGNANVPQVSQNAAHRLAHSIPIATKTASKRVKSTRSAVVKKKMPAKRVAKKAPLKMGLVSDSEDWKTINFETSNVDTMQVSSENAKTDAIQTDIPMANASSPTDSKSQPKKRTLLSVQNDVAPPQKISKPNEPVPMSTVQQHQEPIAHCSDEAINDLVLLSPLIGTEKNNLSTRSTDHWDQQQPADIQRPPDDDDRNRFRTVVQVAIVKCQETLKSEWQRLSRGFDSTDTTDIEPMKRQEQANAQRIVELEQELTNLRAEQTKFVDEIHRCKLTKFQNEFGQIYLKCLDMTGEISNVIVDESARLVEFTKLAMKARNIELVQNLFANL